MTAGRDQVRNSTRPLTANCSGCYCLCAALAIAAVVAFMTAYPGVTKRYRLTIEAVARICFINHCIEYVSTKSRQLIAAIGLDALRLFPFRRCWNYAIRSAALLAMSCPAANAESFSIKCSEAGYFYVSFDTESRKVVEETLSGRPLKGRIDKIDGERIDFHIAIPERPNMDLVWDGSKKSLTVLAIPGDKYRTGNIAECAATELREMLSKYDSILP